jgi:hypothetical protein
MLRRCYLDVKIMLKIGISDPGASKYVPNKSSKKGWTPGALFKGRPRALAFTGGPPYILTFLHSYILTYESLT